MCICTSTIRTDTIPQNVPLGDRDFLHVTKYIFKRSIPIDIRHHLSNTIAPRERRVITREEAEREEAAYKEKREAELKDAEEREKRYQERIKNF